MEPVLIWGVKALERQARKVINKYTQSKKCGAIQGQASRTGHIMFPVPPIAALGVHGPIHSQPHWGFGSGPTPELQRRSVGSN